MGMRKHPRVSGRPSVDICLCNPALRFVCSLHRDGPPPETIEESDALTPDRFALECPWNPDDLPEHLRGYGHHTGWSTNINGEWILPEEDKEGEFMRAAVILLECDVT
jgi:hypothetical protein